MREYREEAAQEENIPDMQLRYYADGGNHAGADADYPGAGVGGRRR